MTEKLSDFFSAGSTEKPNSMNTSCTSKKHRTHCPTQKSFIEIPRKNKTKRNKQQQQKPPTMTEIVHSNYAFVLLAKRLPDSDILILI